MLPSEASRENGAHRRASCACQDQLLVARIPEHSQRRRRRICRQQLGVQQCVIVLYLMGISPVLMQQCEHDYISWPREQCTQPCPATENVQCGYDTAAKVTRYQSDYCCLCVAIDGGAFKPFLCPGSANPSPATRQVSVVEAHFLANLTSQTYLANLSSNPHLQLTHAPVPGTDQRIHRRAACVGHGARSGRGRCADVICSNHTRPVAVERPFQLPRSFRDSSCNPLEQLPSHQ